MQISPALRLLEQISIHSSMGLITAQLEKEETYPEIRILVDGNLAAAVECCEARSWMHLKGWMTTT